MEPVVIITMPACGFNVPHKKHVLRHGFLHLRRTKCEGWTNANWEEYQELKEAQNKPHKHNYQYKPSQRHAWVNPFRYVWVCSDNTCSVVMSVEKSEFRHALLSPHTHYAKPVRVYQKQWPSS